MKDRFRSPGTYVLGTIGVFAIPFLFVKGADWGAEHLLHPLYLIGYGVVGLDVLVLFPLSLVGRLRPYTGGLISLSSYLLGLVAWLYGFVVTYTLWGTLAVAIGLAFLGVGVVFTAMIACVVKTQWAALLPLLLLATVTVGARLAGPVIVSAQPAPEMDAERVSLR